MKKQTFLISIILQTLTCVSIGAAANTHDMHASPHASPELTLLGAITSKLIQPRHDTLQEHTQHLEALTNTFCDSPEKKEFDDLRAGWKAAMQTWSSLAPINFGPIDETEALWRFQFWPDPINLVQRKFDSRLKGSNSDNSPEQLAQASTAIQGLSAIEFLLFDPSITLTDYQTKSHYCTILKGTTSNLTKNSKLLNNAWQQEYPLRWLDIQKDAVSPGYFTHNVESLFSGMVMALDTIKNQKLGTPLGFKKGENSLSAGSKSNPWQAESWRSQTSLAQILATLQFSQNMYEMEFGFSWYLFKKAPNSDVKVLDSNIRDLFASANSLLTDLDKSAFELLTNNDTEKLLLLRTQVEQLHQLLRANYAKATEIQFRFNAKDGD